MGIERPHRQTAKRRSPIKSSLHDIIQNRQCAAWTRCKGFSWRTASASKGWWSRTGSNRRPPACKAGALPAELRPLIISVEKMVGLGGLEPPTSRLSSARSNQLSYKPGAQAQPATAAKRQAAELAEASRQTVAARVAPLKPGRGFHSPAPGASRACDVIREERETKAADPLQVCATAD
jgi:hypothetical protein